MQKWILALSLLGSISAECHENETTASPLLARSEWKQITEHAKCDSDIVTFYDGISICGRLDKIPLLSYTFGHLSFTPNELALISFHPYEETYKVQYITKNGENYISDIPDDKWILWVNDAQGNGKIAKKLDPKAVRYIILSNTYQLPAHSKLKLHSLEFKNGNHVPIMLGSETIHLNDGKNHFTIKACDITDISFNGGLHGYICEGAVAKKLNFSFVNDRFVTVRLLKDGQTIQLPWDQIARVQGNNGGFSQDSFTSSLNTHAVFKQAPISPGVKIVTTTKPVESRPTTVGIPHLKEISILQEDEEIALETAPRPEPIKTTRLQIAQKQLTEEAEAPPPAPQINRKNKSEVKERTYRSVENSDDATYEDLIEIQPKSKSIKTRGEQPVVKTAPQIKKTPTKGIGAGQAKKKTSEPIADVSIRHQSIFEPQNTEDLSDFIVLDEDPLEIDLPEVDLFSEADALEKMYEDKPAKRNARHTRASAAKKNTKTQKTANRDAKKAAKARGE